MRQAKLSRKKLWSCVLGHGLEMYDFTIYGALTTLIALNFFPQSGDSSFLLALVALSTGYVARPLGALFFGYIGDTYGRRRSLILTISVASISTGVVGLCPPFVKIGFMASALLFVARFLQGFCAGAETSDASVFLIESCPEEKSSYASAMIFLSGATGCLIALFISHIFLTLDNENAWRLPFLLGCCGGFFVVYLRFNVTESEEFLLQKNKGILSNSSIFKKLKSQHTPGLVKAVSCGCLSGITSTTIVVFVNLYLYKILGFKMADALVFSLYGLVPFIISCFLCSKISSKQRRNKVIIRAITTLILWGFPYFYLVATGDTLIILFAQIILGASAGAFIAPINSLLSDQFSPEVRCTGISVGYNTGYALTSGLYPILAFKLIEITGNIYSPFIFISFFSGVSLYCIVFFRGRESRNVS